MEEKRELPPYANTLLLAGAALLLGWIVYSAQRSDTPPNPGDVHALAPKTTSNCTALIRECRAKATIKFGECDEAIGRRKVGLALGDPLDAEGCNELSRGFNEICGPGCRLDRNNLLIIPGTLSFKLFDRPDETGNCVARGIQPITVRGNCVPIDDARTDVQPGGR